MFGAWRQFGSFDTRVRLLLLNQFTIKLGFNMLMPYLAGHLTQGLGYAAWALALVLSVRNVSQRAMCLVGGGLADRFGCKGAIVAGCALRTAGFALLGVADSIPALVVASAATGFAGALFDPGVRTYLAGEAGERRAEAFGLFNVAGQAGLLLGPLAGLALSGADFRAVALTAAALFAALTVLQATALPACRAVPAVPEPAAGWRQVVRNRRLMVFAAAMTGAYVLPFQVYLALSLAMQHALAEEQDIGMGQMFALSALVVIAGQNRVTAWARGRWSPGRSLAWGLLVMGLAFVPLVVVASPAPAGFGGEELAETIGILPILLAAVLLALGTTLVCPFEMEVIVALARGRLVGTHYGLYATFSGVAITAGGLVTGAVWELAGRCGLARLPWAGLALLGVSCAAAVAVLDRAGLLRASGPQQGPGKVSAALTEG
ncbi:MFS family permease [Streptosporangium album]|uniref:MFS family permease n=1 Tax=Streptosporangium album TaxID=47479 RepID=A0A7W7WEC2_9ACTN|nr:MFS transporter [Streptosporangium album]MBB4943229.1 MFS family permease [Streptosporangium album]